MYRPTHIVVDFETALLDGSPSLEFYREDFRVLMAGWSWKRSDGSVMVKCTVGEDETRMFFERLPPGVTLICHNYSFEWAVTAWRFPGFEELIGIDTMRLAQLADGGGPEHYEETYESILSALEDRKQFNGLSLEACVSRFCDGESYRHKTPFIDLILERGGKKGDLNLLTPDELKMYNTRDAEVTLALYEAVTANLKGQEVDWTKDHYFYKNRCRLTAEAKAFGVLVDQAQVKSHIEFETSNIGAVENKFFETYRTQITEIEAEKAEAWVNGVKTEKAREGRRQQIRDGNAPQEIKFNLGSTKDKKALFIDKLGLTATFKTPTDNPSFGAKLLWQYGEPGLMIVKLGTHKISRSQAESLKELSARDGRWHLDLKCTGARTNRMSGGSYGET